MTQYPVSRMNRINFLVVLLLLGAASCTSGPKTYVYDPADPFIRIGKINEIDGPVSFDVVVKNNTPDTLYPLRTAVECSCTTVDVYYQPVAPGESITIHTTYDPAYRKGPQGESAALYFKDVAPALFEIQADVVPYNHIITEDHPYAYGHDLYMSHKTLPFGKLAPGETRDIYFRIGNGSTKKANIELVPEGCDKESVRFRQPGKVAADWRDTIHVKFTMPETKVANDTVEFHIQPCVNGEPTEQKMTILAICK